MQSEFREKAVLFLKILIIFNLSFSLFHYFFAKTPAQAAVSATYSEDWVADKTLITAPNIYWGGWWVGYVGDTYYREVAGSQINSSGWAGLSYVYSTSWWNESFKSQPHGFVTGWTVTGTLKK